MIGDCRAARRAVGALTLTLALAGCDADGRTGAWFEPTPDPDAAAIVFVPTALATDPTRPAPEPGRLPQLTEVLRPAATVEPVGFGAPDPEPEPPLTTCAPTWTQQVLDVSAHVPEEASPFDHVGLSIGLAQGWLIAGADGDDDAGLDAGAAWVYRRTEAARWELWDKLTGAGPEHHFGWAVDADGTRLAIGAPGEGPGAVHLFDRVCDGWSEGATLTPPDAAPGALFGASLRLSGDRLIVGAPGAEAAGEGSGAAWIYTRDAALGWRLEAALTPAIAGPGRGFGASVALAGDLAAVGAPEHGAGATHLFRDVDGAWVEEAFVRAADLAPGARFGAAVDCAGDTLLVGAESLTTGGLDQVGGAFVFTLGDHGWGARERLLPRDAEPEAHFGVEVRLTGGVAAVGAWRASTTRGATGAVYLFARTKAGWLQRTKLADAGGGDGDRLGLGIAIDGGVLATGAWSADTVGPDAGKVLVFDDGACDSAAIAEVSPCSPAP